MNRDRAVEILESLVDRIEPLRAEKPGGEQFELWIDAGKTALKQIFPETNEHWLKFARVPFTLPAGSRSTSEQRNRIYETGLDRACIILKARIDEIKTYTFDSRVSGQGSPAIANPKSVFTIHGRQLVTEFNSFLRAIGLEPLEWSTARNSVHKPNPFTWEIVDWALNNAGAIVVLMTSDDEARLKETLRGQSDTRFESELSGQPRQNVLFEAGVAYGRNPERTILVRVGSLRPISDLAGHHILQLDGTPSSRRALADALSLAGCPVDLTGTDWMTAGSFEVQN